MKYKVQSITVVYLQKIQIPHYTCCLYDMCTQMYVALCGSIDPLMCWAHMAGRLSLSIMWWFGSVKTITSATLSLRSHSCMDEVAPHRQGCWSVYEQFLWAVCVCVRGVTKHPACGSLSCQQSVSPRSRHMDVETAVGQPGSGCRYLSVTSWTSADASSALTEANVTHKDRQEWRQEHGSAHLLGWK